MLDNTLKEAEKVLKAVKPLLNKKIAMSLEPYQNGREHGYSIHAWGRSPLGQHYSKVSFSESRGSDNIVVYFGRDLDFDRLGNIPNDEVYKRAKAFKPGQYAVAAKFIANFLNRPNEF